jgi:hypothetical protein
MVRDVSRKMGSAKEKKIIKVNEIFTQDIVLSVRAHMLYLSFYIFKMVVNTTEYKDPTVKPMLILLAKVFALKQLQLDSTACYETGFFAQGSKNLLMESMKKALTDLRPLMIPLVELDSDEYRDKSYLSAIGNKWGDIYEA